MLIWHEMHVANLKTKPIMSPPMTLPQSSIIHKVKHPNGSIWDVVPESNLNEAVSRGGVIVEEPTQSPPTQPLSNPQNLPQAPTQAPAIQQLTNNPKVFKVKTPDGKLWDIPEHNLEAAKSRGGVVVDPGYNGVPKTHAKSVKTVGTSRQ